MVQEKLYIKQIWQILVVELIREVYMSVHCITISFFGKFEAFKVE